MHFCQEMANVRNIHFVYKLTVQTVTDVRNYNCKGQNRLERARARVSKQLPAPEYYNADSYVSTCAIHPASVTATCI